eukprot:3599199-Pleurochrysis_carterae.AAC.1
MAHPMAHPMARPPARPGARPTMPGAPGGGRRRATSSTCLSHSRATQGHRRHWRERCGRGEPGW